MDISVKLDLMVRQYRIVNSWFQMDIRNLVWRMNEATFRELEQLYVAATDKKTPLVGGHFLGIPIEVVEADEILLVLKVA